MKKFLCLSLVSIMFLNIGTFAFASATEITEKQKATNFFLNMDDNYAYYFDKHRGYLQYNTHFNDTSAKRFYVFSKYMHQNKSWSVTPSISFPFNPGLSVTSSNHFETMTPNPVLTYTV